MCINGKINTISNGLFMDQTTAGFDEVRNLPFFIAALNKSGIANAHKICTLSSFSVAGFEGFDNITWNTDVWQCVNELKIDKSDLVDYDIASKSYDWYDRELAADQLEELSAIIDLNSDGTTTGRIFSIQNNLGITLNCQISLDQLVTNGWVIIQ